MKLTIEDFTALGKFIGKYHDWWYKIGVCDVSCDFDCAPQSISPEIMYAKPSNIWDSGFTYDSKVSLKDAIEQVMEQIEWEEVQAEK